MAINQPGIAISIKGFLPTGKTLDEQFAALTIVKTAHETGDYSELLKAAHDVEVKTEQKTRRVEEKPAPAAVQADAPVEDVVEKAKRLGLPWKGLTNEAITAGIEEFEAAAEKLPDVAPEGEPSLQDVADYGADDGAGMAAPVKQDNRAEDWQAAQAENANEGQSDWLAQPEEPAPEAAPEQQPARARRKVNGNE